MKFMLIWRQTAADAWEQLGAVDFDQMLETVGRFNEELIEAGVLLAAEGLAPAEEGVVVDFSSEPPVVTDGPYGETKELFNGFYLINVASRDEAVEWARRIPQTGPGFKTEIRRVLHKGKTAVWLPFELQRDKLEADTNWDVTSDSIALDLARKLNAERLVLVKSCLVDPELTMSQLGETGVVDRRFASLAGSAAFPIEILNKGELGRMRSLLLGDARSEAL